MTSLPIDTIICGDCLELLKKIPDGAVDLVLTDPPYDERTHKGGMFTGEIVFGNVDFAPLDIVPCIANFLRMANRWVLCFVPIETLGLIQQAYPSQWIRSGIWDRIINSPQISGDRPAQAVEGIAILHRVGHKYWNGGGKAGIWRHMVERGKKLHRTQKPLSLLLELIQLFSDPDDLILDPFCGSGTTCMAAKMLGRHYISIDISEDYCHIARERLTAVDTGVPVAEARRGQLPLFVKNLAEGLDDWTNRKEQG